MKKRTHVAAALAMLVLAGAGQAQAGNCRGRYVLADISGVRQELSPDGRYLYYVNIHNRMAYPVTLDVSYSGFERVTIGAPLMPNLQLPAGGRLNNLLFGFGSNNNINGGTVRRVYDAQPASGATIRLSNCRQ